MFDDDHHIYPGIIPLPKKKSSVSKNQACLNWYLKVVGLCNVFDDDDHISNNSLLILVSFIWQLMLLSSTTDHSWIIISMQVHS